MLKHILMRLAHPGGALSKRAAAAAVALARAVLRAAGLPLGVAMETAYACTCYGPDGRVKWTETARNRVVTAGLNKLLDATFKTGLTSPAWFVGLVAPAIDDAAITATETTLTSASDPWTNDDAGRVIIVRGAGAGGADLRTTIASVTAAGEVELADAASTTVTGAKAIWEARPGDTMASHAPWSEDTNYAQANRPAFTPGTIAGGSVDNDAAQASFTINQNNTLIGGAFLADSNSKGGTSGVLYGMAPFATSIRQLDDGDTLAVKITLTAASQ